MNTREFRIESRLEEMSQGKFAFGKACAKTVLKKWWTTYKWKRNRRIKNKCYKELGYPSVVKGDGLKIHFS